MGSGTGITNYEFLGFLTALGDQHSLTVPTVDFLVQLLQLIISNGGSNKVQFCGALQIADSAGKLIAIPWTAVVAAGTTHFDALNKEFHIRQLALSLQDVLWEVMQGLPEAGASMLDGWSKNTANILGPDGKRFPPWVFVPVLWADKLNNDQRVARLTAGIGANFDEPGQTVHDLRPDQESVTAERTFRAANARSRIKEANLGGRAPPPHLPRVIPPTT
jgi:hypothetical protein